MEKPTSVDDRSCSNCLYRGKDHKSIDEVPPTCWDCSASHYSGGPRLPYWAPDIDPEEEINNYLEDRMKEHES